MTTHPDGTITASHWGTYRVQTSNGRVTGVKAFENDPEPSPMIEAMPGMLYADCRVAQPMVRRGGWKTAIAAIRRGAAWNRSWLCSGIPRWTWQRRR